MSSRRTNDGLSKRCGCARRVWLRCQHSWHVDFHFKRTAHLYGGRAKHRYSLDIVAQARNEESPRTKSDAEALADRIRSEIRLGTFRPPNQPEQPPAPDPTAPLTVADVIDAYTKGHVPYLEYGRPRREAAQRAMKWHLALLNRIEIPAAHGQTVAFGSKPIRDVVRADVEAIRAARQRAHAETTTAKTGSVGINRLLARLRHLFTWAVANGYVDKTPFHHNGVVVVKLNSKAESPRDRRLRDSDDPRQSGEEDRLITHASTPLMRDLIIAGISTGMRLGELLSLQWREVEHATNAKGEPVAVALRLSSEKTKDSDPRRVPVGARLAAVLAMRRHGPDGKELKPDAYVFGNEVGEQVRSVKRAWATTKLKAHGYTPIWRKGSNQLAPESLAALRVIDLNFHDLRAEFSSRVIESGGSTVDARDLLGHTTTKQTDSYLRSRSKGLAQAIARKEAHEAQLAAERARLAEEEARKNSHTNGVCGNSEAMQSEDSEAAQVVKH